LGCAAVGCVDKKRTRNQPKPEKYLAVTDLASLEAETEALDAQAIIREALMLGLRTSEGVDLRELEQRAAIDPRKGRERAFARLLEQGRLTLDGDRMRVPHAHWLQLDGIVTDLF
jgi:coproporphyrinogen III oxidase-like Fe-S oxidoreductase